MSITGFTSELVHFVECHFFGRTVVDAEGVHYYRDVVGIVHGRYLVLQ